MRTDDLITMLATGTGPVDTNVAARRYAAALFFGATGAILLMVMLLGVRTDLAHALFLPRFWIKAGVVTCVTIASLVLALRLSQPGRRLGRVPSALVAPVLAVWILAAVVLINADPLQRTRLFLGDTWAVCPFLIAMLSVPVFGSTIWAMRGLAPTRLRLAGAAAGLLAGTTGALVYCIHCPEMEAPFLGFWYLLGMLIPAAVGALSGRLLLRW
ncbi:MAG: hypothetical protein FD157_1882 [Rhodocyclaceae bacterium]|nr:MAG: hypothetical protein FD157_1882 [Rhodocyclaceae bacterium]TNC99262.1 MAG: hypothetical protein FD118_3833 [Rhodocyclaceae bacterium]